MSRTLIGHYPEIRKERKRPEGVTPWHHNRSVLEDILGCLGVRPEERYSKATPYMDILDVFNHWGGLLAASVIGLYGNQRRGLEGLPGFTENGRAELSRQAADFADHWRSIGYHRLLLAYPRQLHVSESASECVKRDTARVHEFLGRGLELGDIQRSFYIAPGRAEYVCEMMLHGVPDEYLLAATRESE